MPAPAATTVVITDANVLINFVHIGQVALLGELPAYRFQLLINAPANDDFRHWLLVSSGGQVTIVGNHNHKGAISILWILQAEGFRRFFS